MIAKTLKNPEIFNVFVIFFTESFKNPEMFKLFCKKPSKTQRFQRFQRFFAKPWVFS